jgi:hypothetical protein
MSLSLHIFVSNLKSPNDSNKIFFFFQISTVAQGIPLLRLFCQKKTLSKILAFRIYVTGMYYASKDTASEIEQENIH